MVAIAFERYRRHKKAANRVAFAATSDADGGPIGYSPSPDGRD
jgi:hypothetical protein